MKQHLFIALAVIPIAAGPALADNATTVSLGYSRTSGDYGLDRDTTATIIPFSVTRSQGKWSAGITVPWVKIEGFGTVLVTGRGSRQISSSPNGGMYTSTGPGGYGSGGGMTSSTTGYTRVSESGLGDINIFAGYDLVSSDNGPTVNLTGTVKFASGDEDKGLGSGGTDYGIETGISYPVGRLTPFATAGYTFTGSGGGVDYQDYPYLSLGADLSITRGLDVAISWDWSDSLSNDSEAASEINAELDLKINRTWTATLTAGAGLSDASPDTSYGAGLSARF